MYIATLDMMSRLIRGTGNELLPWLSTRLDTLWAAYACMAGRAAVSVHAGAHGGEAVEGVVPLTIRKALIFYGASVVFLLAAAWCLALFYDWQSGMILLTVVLLEHAWRVVRMIMRNKS